MYFTQPSQSWPTHDILSHRSDPRLEEESCDFDQSKVPIRAPVVSYVGFPSPLPPVLCDPYFAVMLNFTINGFWFVFLRERLYFASSVRSLGCFLMRTPPAPLHSWYHFTLLFVCTRYISKIDRPLPAAAPTLPPQLLTPVGNCFVQRNFRGFENMEHCPHCMQVGEVIDKWRVLAREEKVVSLGAALYEAILRLIFLIFPFLKNRNSE